MQVQPSATMATLSSVEIENKEENKDNNKQEKKRFQWKGKFVTEKVYNQRFKQSQAGRNTKKVPEEEATSSAEPPTPPVIEGSRLIDFETFIEHLHCRGCNTDLLLQNIEKEIIHGLASVFLIRCHWCLLVNEVPTSKTHTLPGRRKPRFEINTKYALGILQGELEYDDVDKWLAVMNIPRPSYQMYKEHEKLIGEAAMVVEAQSSGEQREQKTRE